MRRQRRDEGFTLLEVVATIVIIGMMVLFTLPVTTGSIKATGFAGRLLGAKAVAQAELERMRGLPFHVPVGELGDGSTDASGRLVRSNAIDLLDRYLPSTATGGSLSAKGCSSEDFDEYLAGDSGWVTSTAGGRCPGWELDAAFYRVVRPNSAPDGLTVVVNTQFVRGAPITVAPILTPYDSLTQGIDTPVARDLRVTVVVGGRGLREPVQLTSYVSDPGTRPTRLTTELDARALSIRTVLTDDALPLILDAAIANVRGSSTASTSMEVLLAGVQTSLGGVDGTTTRGANAVLSIPPDSAPVAASSGPARVPESSGSCADSAACWPNTSVSAPALTTAFGTLTAGSPSAPLRSAVRVTESLQQRLRVNQPRTRTDTTLFDGLDAVRVESTGPAPTGTDTTPCSAGASPIPVDAVGSRGWVTATRDRLTPVEVCATSSTPWVTLLPPTFRGEGLVRVGVARSVAYCRTGPAPLARILSEVQVQVRVGETWVDVDQSGGLPSLAAVTLQGRPERPDLTPYLDSWSLGTSSTATTASRAGAALDAAVSVRTVPLGTLPDGAPDPATAVNVQLGSVSCQVEDRR